MTRRTIAEEPETHPRHTTRWTRVAKSLAQRFGIAPFSLGLLVMGPNLSGGCGSNSGPPVFEPAGLGHCEGTSTACDGREWTNCRDFYDSSTDRCKLVRECVPRRDARCDPDDEDCQPGVDCSALNEMECKNKWSDCRSESVCRGNAPPCSQVTDESDCRQNGCEWNVYEWDTAYDRTSI